MSVIFSSWVPIALALAVVPTLAMGEVAQCTKEFPNGVYYDLAPLMRELGTKDYFADDRNGNSYYFNVCGDATEVPQECLSLAKAVQAPAYQVTNQSDCFWLGQLKSMEWELIDEKYPAAGIELYYFDGEQCLDGISRDIRISFTCDDQVGVGRPHDYYVMEQDCHYSVTWPSQYGCPVPGGAGGGGWVFLTFFFFAVVAYVSVGCAYNNVRLGARIGPEAMPHSEFWREFPQLVQEGCKFSYDTILRWMGRESAYQTVEEGGVDYEWG